MTVFVMPFSTLFDSTPLRGHGGKLVNAYEYAILLTHNFIIYFRYILILLSMTKWMHVTTANVWMAGRKLQTHLNSCQNFKFWSVENTVPRGVFLTNEIQFQS